LPERKPRILVVDDRRALAETLADGLADRGYDARAAESGAEALQLLQDEQVDLLVTDLRMPGVDGLQLLEQSRRLDPERAVIMMTAFGAVDTAIESIRRGAYHYLSKPFKVEELAVFVARALEESRLRRALRTTLRERFEPAGVVGSSQGLRDVLERVRRVANADVPVLLLGETGTGKGMIARALHAASRRATGPFVAVNCAALPETLLESELFGHVKGAFTGADKEKRGLFEEADGGTLLLDEIGELPLLLQGKLLHVLETGTVRPVGATRERKVDVRLLAATHRDLRELVAEGALRQDLYFRLDVVPIELPPLRRRPEDVPALVEHYFAQARERHPSSPVQSISPEAMAALRVYTWPGNVRELQHLMERLVLLGNDAAVGLDDLPATVAAPEATLASLMRGPVLPFDEVKRRYARWALEQFGGHRGRTAEALDVTPKTLAVWLDGG
jgi:two-component system response regulator HydG